VDYEIIVVDNASYDGCGERLSRYFPDVIYVQSHCNLGFGRANNLGVQHSKGEVLLFLNPDTEVLEHAIDRLYEHYKNLDKPGAVGCKLINSDGSLQTSCVQPLPTVLNQILDTNVLRHLFPKSGMWGTEAFFFSTEEPVEVEAISGACLMIRKDSFERLEGFSPEFFMYGEDLDLCFKARNAGLHNYYVNNAMVVHHGGGSTNHSVSDFSNVMMRESIYRLLSKTNGRIYSNCYRIALSVTAVLRIALLGLLFPAWVSKSGRKSWTATVRKWFYILRWGLGFERWVRNYNQFKKISTNKKSDKLNSCAESAEN
jgi:GT2 family glycosyltransferase